MQFHKPTTTANIILLIIIGVLLGLFGLAGIGAAAIIVAAINLFLVLIFLLTQNKPAMKTALLFGGVLLLIGFSLCSAFQFSIH